MVKMKPHLILIVVGLVGIGQRAQSEVIVATETSRGEYEKGVFTPGKPEFRYRFDVDEKSAKARLTEVVRLKSGDIVQLTVDYAITTAEDASAASNFLVSEGRRNQRIVTLVGKPGRLATEVILLGENFFEYCKASSGRFYLSSGTIKRSISGEQDTLRQLMKGTEMKSKPE